MRESRRLLKNFQTLAPALAAFGVALLATLVARRLCLRWLCRKSTGPNSFPAVFAQTLGLPAVLWCLAAAIAVALRFAELPERQTRRAGDWIEFFIIVSFSLVAASISVRMISSYGERQKMPLALAGLSKTLIRVFVLSVGALVLLRHVGLDITPLLTALGVGGLAVALALQDTLANFFAGIHILMEQPISVGDFIRLASGEEGVVTDIGWRTTRLAVWSNSAVVIPNTKVATSILTNFSLPDARVVAEIPLLAALEADPVQVRKFALEEAAATEGVLPEPAPLFLCDPGVTPTHLQCKLLVAVKDRARQGLVVSELRMRLLERFRKEAVPLPAPILRAG